MNTEVNESRTPRTFQTFHILIDFISATLSVPLLLTAALSSFASLTTASTPIDTRVEHFPFLGSPIPIVILIVAYVYSVTIWGPNLMKPRKAYDLKGVIKIYNLIQIFTNLYIGIIVSVKSFFFIQSF